MKHRKLLYSILYFGLLLSLVNLANAFFNKNRNKDGEQQQRRRLSQRNMAEVDVDAATGTVYNVVSEAQKAADEAAKTCDGQMAQSLVKANEGMLLAQTERDEALKAKQDALAKIAVLETTVDTLTKKLDDAEIAHSKAVADLNQQMEDVRADRDAQLKAKDDASASQLQDMEMTKDGIIGELKTQLQSAREIVEAEYNVIVDNLKQTHADEVSALNADMESRVAALEQQLKDQAAEADNVLRTTKDEAKMYMITQVNAVKEEMAQMQKAHEEREDENAGKLKRSDEVSKRFMEEKTHFQKLSEDLQEEVDMWRQNFKGRRYINYTDIYVDVAYAMNTALHHTGETAGHLWEKLEENLEGTIEKVQISYKESKVKFDKFYDEQHAIYWPKIEPHYNEYIVPLIHKKDEAVKEFGAWKQREFDPRYKEFEKEYNKRHSKIVRIYGEQCKAAMRSADELNLPYFDEVKGYANKSCTQPETSVRYIRNGLIVLLLFPFRHYILAPVYWLWGIVWYILLTITPLGFFFSKKKAASATENGKANGNSNTNGVRVKKKGKNVAQ